MNKVSRIIKSLRAPPCGLSQVEIGRFTGIPQGRISKWENGIVPKSINDAFKLIELGERFGVSVPRSSRKGQRK